MLVPQAVCFVVSQLSRVDRHAGRFKHGSDPAKHILPLSLFVDLRQLRNFYAFCISFRLFTFLRYRIPECSVR